MIVEVLGAVGVQPQRHPDAWPRGGSIQVSAWQGHSDAERHGFGVEHHCAGGTGRESTQPEPGLIELGGTVEVPYLQGDEIRSGHCHGVSDHDVNILTSTNVCQDIDMPQIETVGPLDESVGYLLKQAATALRSAMDDALRPLELSVPQYACLELLGQRSGLSNADLARGAFVTRQSMNGVLRGLQDRGLVSRPATAPSGRALPSKLTPSGRRCLQNASAKVRAVEKRMLTSFSPAGERAMRLDLAACIAALSQGQVDPPTDA
jgi:DNA-binding MarR family transcriptional regulator